MPSGTDVSSCGIVVELQTQRESAEALTGFSLGRFEGVFPRCRKAAYHFGARRHNLVRWSAVFDAAVAFCCITLHRGAVGPLTNC